MKIEVVDTYEGFLGLESTWNRLLEESRSGHVCLTFEWMKCWWLAFGENCRLFILLVREMDDSLIAIAPFMLSRGRKWGIPVKKIGFIYNDNASRADFIITRKREQALDIILSYVRSLRNTWDIVELENISEDSPNYDCVRQACLRATFSCLIKDGLNSPFIPIDSDWETYYSGRSQKLRRTLKNLKNRLEKVCYSIERIVQGSGAKEVLEQMCAISSKSWKSKHRCDISHSRENQRFFSELNEALGSRGWLNIWLMHINGAAVAYEFSLRYKDKAYALRADFDQGYKHLSPGTMLHCDLLRHYFQNAARECDLCGNDEEYKKRWTQYSRRHYTFILYHRTLMGRLWYLAEGKLAYPLKRFLKQFEPLKKLKRKIFSNR